MSFAIGQKVRPTQETARTLKAFFGVEGEGVVEQINEAFGQAYVRFGAFSVIDSFSSFEAVAGAKFKAGDRVTSRWAPGGCTWVIRSAYLEGGTRKYEAEVVGGAAAWTGSIAQLFECDLKAAELCQTPAGFNPPPAVPTVPKPPAPLVEEVAHMLQAAFPAGDGESWTGEHLRNAAKEVIGAVIKRLSDELAR